MNAKCIYVCVLSFKMCGHRSPAPRAQFPRSAGGSSPGYSGIRRGRTTQDHAGTRRDTQGHAVRRLPVMMMLLLRQRSLGRHAGGEARWGWGHPGATTKHAAPKMNSSVPKPRCHAQTVADESLCALRAIVRACVRARFIPRGDALW